MRDKIKIDCWEVNRKCESEEEGYIPRQMTPTILALSESCSRFFLTGTSALKIEVLPCCIWKRYEHCHWSRDSLEIVIIGSVIHLSTFSYPPCPPLIKQATSTAIYQQSFINP